MGVSPVGAKVHVTMAAWPWGAYMGEDGLKKGIRVKTSSFARHHVNVTMARAKVATTYANSILANLEATQEGYDEGLLLDTDGFVAEGAGENLFIVTDRREYTPTHTTALDGSVTGQGSGGPVTESIQTAFFDIVHGRNPKYHHWLSPVQAQNVATVGA